MKKILFVLLGCVLSVTGVLSVEGEPVGYVDPFIGTTNFGHTFPGPAVPFGMVQLSPDTDTPAWDYCSGYLSRDDSIMGFSHTHLTGTGRAEFGNVLIMPVIGELKTVPGTRQKPDAGYRSRFTHDSEKAEPGYYAVTLEDYGINVELTATRRCGFHRYTFPSGKAHILVDVSHRLNGSAKGEVKVVNGNQIEGYTRCDGKSGGWSFPVTVDNVNPVVGSSGTYTTVGYTVYFAAKFSKPFASSCGTWKAGEVREHGKQESGERVGAFVCYSTKKNEEILVKVGISYVSIDGARRNLEAEIPGWDFDRIRQSARGSWNKELSKIEVSGCTEAQKSIFYTALYHSLLCPYSFSDIDGKYTGMDGEIHEAEDYTHYHLFSLWDTFRAEHPLLVLIQPQVNIDMIKSLIAKYQQGGWLPKWSLANNYSSVMIGAHATSVIADAYLKGLRGFDIGKAYQGMRKDALEVSTTLLYEGRGGIDYYIELGYVPADKVWESVSRTLEFAYDDFCLAQLAGALGKQDDRELFMNRALYYRNVFDSSTGFMRGRNSDGSWIEPFEPMAAVSSYTEGNAWQYSWFVPHDVEGLIKLMGGNEKFINKLDMLFKLPSKPVFPNIVGLIGQYAHGNEPSQHIAYLYNYAGEPWKTQQRVRQIMEERYGVDRMGLCGNDDCGQMSAWYVFSAMGFYPVCPSRPFYDIGSPIFEEVTIHLDNGKDFVIEARNTSQENKYIQQAKLNGIPLNSSRLRHSDLTAGGELIFEMGPEPNKAWGSLCR